MYKFLSSKPGLQYYQEMYTKGTAANVTIEVAIFLKEVYWRVW